MIRQLRSAATLAAGSALLVALAAAPTLAGSRAPAATDTGRTAAHLTVDPSLSATPTPATTATPGPYREWIPASCATGGFDPLEVDAQLNVVIPGQVTLCGRWAGKYAFTVVAFRPDRELAFAFSSRLRSYDPTGPTPVRAAFVTPPAVGSTGICLMRSSTVRIACLAVDVDAQYRITSRPLPVDDPLVTKPVLYQDDALSPEPGSGFCATCVGLS
ncbi:hypothetical protein [Micromonospora sp. NPDC092111]|uniref:hypothetical protein n=1 Tax=Micromonospora sp. NPDC092111 TaxID=3364289 RepID=UPI00381939F7